MANATPPQWALPFLLNGVWDNAWLPALEALRQHQEPRTPKSLGLDGSPFWTLRNRAPGLVLSDPNEKPVRFQLSPAARAAAQAAIPPAAIAPAGKAPAAGPAPANPAPANPAPVGPAPANPAPAAAQVPAGKAPVNGAPAPLAPDAGVLARHDSSGDVLRDAPRAFAAMNLGTRFAVLNSVTFMRYLGPAAGATHGEALLSRAAILDALAPTVDIATVIEQIGASGARYSPGPLCML